MFLSIKFVQGGVDLFLDPMSTYRAAVLGSMVVYISCSTADAIRALVVRGIFTVITVPAFMFRRGTISALSRRLAVFRYMPEALALEAAGDKEEVTDYV